LYVIKSGYKKNWENFFDVLLCEIIENGYTGSEEKIIKKILKTLHFHGFIEKDKTGRYVLEEIFLNDKEVYFFPYFTELILNFYSKNPDFFRLS
jgi:hypothetical protein